MFWETEEKKKFLIVLYDSTLVEQLLKLLYNYRIDLQSDLFKVSN